VEAQVTREPEAPADAGRLLTDALLGATDTDPYEHYRLLREAAPVLLTRNGILVLSRYDDIYGALRHQSLGRAADEALSIHADKLADDQLHQAMRWWRRTVLFTNPPDHTRLRRLISGAFTPRHVERLRTLVAAYAEEALDELARQQGGDFMQVVALSLPVKVIAKLLGIAAADWAEFAPVVRDMVEMFEPLADAETLVRAVAAQQRLAGYFADLLAAKRRQPGDDLLSRLAVSCADDALDDTEMIATAILLFTAGFETTTNLLGNGLYALLTHPSQLALLREQPQMIPRAVEELLRFDPPAQLTSRTVLYPCTIAGVDLSAGQTVLALLASANRDPARFTAPDCLDVTRDEGPSLTFASGTHFCLGAHLARLEGAEFFTQLLRRYDGIELAGPARRRPGRSLRGFAELPVSLVA
jgi:cytochrome P450